MAHSSVLCLSGGQVEAQEPGTQPPGTIANYCWSYDAFGNRLQQMGSNEAITGGGVATCQQQAGAAIHYAWANYSGNNQMSSTSQNVNQSSGYDAAGDITNDSTHQYLYNADGQICAVEWTYNSITVMTGYIYDAEGNRVAKGAITSMSCDPSTNGFTTQADYVRDQAGHQLSEFAPGTGGVMAWQHTNVYASGELIGGWPTQAAFGGWPTHRVPHSCAFLAHEWGRVWAGDITNGGKDL